MDDWLWVHCFLLLPAYKSEKCKYKKLVATDKKKKHLGLSLNCGAFHFTRKMHHQTKVNNQHQKMLIKIDVTGKNYIQVF